MKTKIFYRVKEMAGEKETGPVYPQCDNFIKGVDPDMPHSFFDVVRCVRDKQSFPDFKPAIDGQKLAIRAKPTDFLSCALYNTITKKGVRALDKLNFTEHRIYPMKIYARKTPLLYFHVPFLEYGQDAIVWDKCEFYKSDLAFKTTNLDSIYLKRLSDEILTFTSYEDYRSYTRSVSFFIKILRLAVNGSFNMELDHFKSSITIDQYVSERFIETYQANNLTGLKFENPIEVVQY